MSHYPIVPVNPSFASQALVTADQYRDLYHQSLDDPETFWAEQAKRLDWIEPWKTVKDTSFDKPVHIRWFEGGKLNVSANCIDRHLPQHADRTAIIWEGDEPGNARHISYQELHDETCRMANVLKKLGVVKGDRVTLYLPMIPEAAYAMLACARIGAVHSVVFGGFSPSSLKNRIHDCNSKVIITADEGVRGGKQVPLKANTDEAIALLQEEEDPTQVEHVLVVRRTGGDINWDNSRDHWYHEEATSVSADCPPEPMDAEDPLFILYTSGSTGKPKGLQHTTGGYLLYATLTHELIFDYKPDDIYWCTADVGWITGHSYIVYGPLANCATTLMFEGVPNYPDFSRFWQVVDTHKVSIFYTAPTAIRALMREGDEWVQKTSRQSLRLLGSVGEPINPEAWRWYYDVVGDKRCPIVDTWWQTETGGILISPLPGAMDLKPGSALKPFFGILPQIVDQENHVLEGKAEGYLCIADSWPGQARTIYGDHDRFEQTYFSNVPGKYFTGDGANRDEDGDYWITGRVDDVLNVSGHRMGTAEIESALVEHKAVAEAAVVGFPHDIKGEGIYAYVILNPSYDDTEELMRELNQWVRQKIGPIATPDEIHVAPGLPKTRSGKIMRRILRKIAANDYKSLGDTSTLLNPEVVNELIERRKQIRP